MSGVGFSQFCKYYWVGYVTYLVAEGSVFGCPELFNSWGCFKLCLSSSFSCFLLCLTLDKSCSCSSTLINSSPFRLLPFLLLFFLGEASSIFLFSAVFLSVLCAFPGFTLECVMLLAASRGLPSWSRLGSMAISMSSMFSSSSWSETFSSPDWLACRMKSSEKTKSHFNVQKIFLWHGIKLSEMWALVCTFSSDPSGESCVVCCLNTMQQ